jgi:hypothetical protein
LIKKITIQTKKKSGLNKKRIKWALLKRKKIEIPAWFSKQIKKIKNWKTFLFNKVINNLLVFHAKIAKNMKNYPLINNRKKIERAVN